MIKKTFVLLFSLAGILATLVVVSALGGLLYIFITAILNAV